MRGHCYVSACLIAEAMLRRGVFLNFMYFVLLHLFKLNQPIMLAGCESL